MVAVVAGGDPSTDDESEELNGTTGDLEILGAKSAEAKGLDNDRSKLKGFGLVVCV